MKEVFFIDHNTKTRKPIGKAESDIAIFRIMNDYIQRINFKSYYTRVWPCNEGVMFDFGSHTQFFLVKETGENE